MSSPSPPPAPDYVGAAQATAAGNLANTELQTAANRVNQIGPDGSSLTYTNSGTPGDPNWTQTETLSAPEQAALTSEEGSQAGLAGLAGGMVGNVNGTMSQPFQAPSLSSYMSGVPGVNTGYTGFNSSGVPGVNMNAPQFSNATAQAGANAAYGSEMDLIQPGMTQALQSNENQLALSGLAPGSQAYNNSMQSLENNQALQTNQAAASAVQTGNEEANQNYASELAGYGAGNTAQAQDYGQALQGYDTGQTALQNFDTAQQAEFGEGQQGYQTAYNAALENYNEPLNAYDSVASAAGGVTTPTYPSYSEQGYALGTNYTSAANAAGAYNSNMYASQQQAQGEEIGGGLAAAGTIAAVVI